MNVLETVSLSNHLGFQDHPEKVAQFLSFNHKDLSSAIGLPNPANNENVSRGDSEIGRDRKRL